MPRINKAAHDIFLTITEGEKGGIINSANMARQIAEIILENYKNDDPRTQMPLNVEDRGDTWFVQGSLNRDMKQPGWGPWEIEFRKRDAAIIHLVQRYNQDLPAMSVKP